MSSACLDKLGARGERRKITTYGLSHAGDQHEGIFCSFWTSHFVCESNVASPLPLSENEFTLRVNFHRLANSWSLYSYISDDYKWVAVPDDSVWRTDLPDTPSINHREGFFANKPVSRSVWHVGCEHCGTLAIPSNCRQYLNFLATCWYLRPMLLFFL